MTLALSGTSPAIAEGAYSGAATASLASNSFTPPSGAVIFVTAWASSEVAAVFNSSTITDSLGSHLTWTKVGEQNSSSGESDVVVWWAYAGAGGTAMTATPSMSVATTGGNYIGSMDVAVKIFTGANTSNPVGTVVQGQSTTSSTLAESITPEYIGSALFLAAIDNPTGHGSDATTAGTNCYQTDVDNAPGGFGALCQVDYGTSGGPTLTTSLSPLTLTINTTDTSPIFEYIGFEVVPFQLVVTAPSVLYEYGFAQSPTIEILSASVLLNNASTTVRFDWGTTVSYGNNAGSVIADPDRGQPSTGNPHWSYGQYDLLLPHGRYKLGRYDLRSDGDVHDPGSIRTSILGYYGSRITRRGTSWLRGRSVQQWRHSIRRCCSSDCHGLSAFGRSGQYHRRSDTHYLGEHHCWDIRTSVKRHCKHGHNASDPHNRHRGFRI